MTQREDQPKGLPTAPEHGGDDYYMHQPEQGGDMSTQAAGYPARKYDDAEHRTTRQPFTSNSPQAGQLSEDERIREEACDAIVRIAQVDCLRLDIDVRDGNVRVKGKVDTEERMRLVEAAVRSVRGVTGLDSHLKLSKEAKSSGLTDE